MLERFDRLFGRWPRVAVAAMAIAAALLLGLADTLSGYEISFSVFYLAPIAFASWYGGARAGALLCLVSAVIWFAADLLAGRVYSHQLIPFWNAGVRWGFFATTSSLLVSLRRHLGAERALARTDALTGLLNSRAFGEACAHHLELARRHERPLAIGYLDLDDFKRVNDLRGHSEGDRLLRAVASTLAERLRETDLAGRLGGDEFAVLLPDTDAAGAERLFTEIRERLGRLFDSESWHAGVSAGVVVFTQAPPTVDEAVRQADTLMYDVKRSGKGGFRVREAGLRRAG